MHTSRFYTTIAYPPLIEIAATRYSLDKYATMVAKKSGDIFILITLALANIDGPEVAY